MGETRITAEPGTQQIVITRTFDSPRELVFKAFTDPDQIVQWLGPRHLTMTIDEMDVRPGGSWQFVHHEEDGREYGFRGVTHDVVVPERIVRTFEFEGAPGEVSLEDATFSEQDGRTTLTMTSVFLSVAARDAMIQSGMEVGVNQSMDRLAELLAKSLVATGA
jgi:uncharacterized protein YndB with AHSA1/START domain